MKSVNKVEKLRRLIDLSSQSLFIQGESLISNTTKVRGHRDLRTDDDHLYNL